MLRCYIIFLFRQYIWVSRTNDTEDHRISTCFLLTFRYFHSISSTLAALNIGHFGCGMSLRSGGWIGWLITRIYWGCKIVEDYS